MESDKNPFPKLDLFPRLTNLSRFLLGTLHAETENTGGAPMLDRELYEQMELDYGTNEQTI